MLDEPHEQGGSEGDSGVAMHVLDRIWKVLSNGIGRLSEHRGTQLAASMAYYALLSVFPAAIVLAAVAGQIVKDRDSQQQVIDYLLRNLPLSDSSGPSDVQSLLDGVAAHSGTLGLIGLAVLIFSASALVSAARNSLSMIFGEDIRRGFVRGKALDLLLVFALGLVFVLAFVASIAGRFEIAFTGWFGEIVNGVVSVASTSVVPLIVAAVLFTAAFKVLPAERRPLRDLWPGIVFAAVGYEVVRRGFAIYLDGFSHYSAVYGSLGAVVAFMFFVYLASLVFLLGAGMAAVWPGVRDGEYDGDPGEDGESVGEAIGGWLKRLFTRNPVDPPPR